MEKLNIKDNIIVEDDDVEIDVIVNYRCFFSPNLAFYPMERSGSIFKGKTLQDFINEGVKDYKKSYEKVEVVDVFVDDGGQLAIDKLKKTFHDSCNT